MKLAKPLPQIYLRPGEIFFTEKPALVSTVLGSCVTITFFSAWPRCAGICHAMLSTPGRSEAGPANPGRFKYLSEAIPFMVAHFRSLGIHPSAIEVKIFGGANVISRSPLEAQSERSIGKANIATAHQMLEAESLLIKAGNVGGHFGRKLFFDTETGQVMHKHLAGPNQHQVS